LPAYHKSTIKYLPFLLTFVLASRILHLSPAKGPSHNDLVRAHAHDARFGGKRMATGTVTAQAGATPAVRPVARPNSTTLSEPATWATRSFEDRGRVVRHPLSRIRLLLAYKHTLLRQALRTLLSAQGEVEVLAEAEDGKDAVEKAEQLKPDVVLMDVALPILNGVEATRLIRKRVRNARVLLLTLAANDDDILQVLQAGAAGCLLKEADAAELNLAIQAVHRGASYLSPTISDRMVQSYIRLARAAQTPRPPPP